MLKPLFGETRKYGISVLQVGNFWKQQMKPAFGSYSFNFCRQSDARIPALESILPGRWSILSIDYYFLSQLMPLWKQTCSFRYWNNFQTKYLTEVLKLLPNNALFAFQTSWNIFWGCGCVGSPGIQQKYMSDWEPRRWHLHLENVTLPAQAYRAKWLCAAHPCVLPVFGCRYRDWSSPSAAQPCPNNHNPLSRLSAVSLHWQYSDHQIQAFALGPETVLSFCFSWYIRMQSEHFLMPNLLNTATRMYSLLFLYYTQQFKSTVPRNSCIKYWYSFCSGFLLHGVRVTEEIQLCERLPPSHHSHSDAFYLFFRQHLSLLVRPSSWCPSFPDSWKIVSYLHILKQSALYLMSFLMHGLSRSGTPR